MSFRFAGQLPLVVRRAIPLAVMGLAASIAAGGVTRSLVPSATPTTQATIAVHEFRFDLLALNDADAAAGFAWPATLPCKLTTPDGAVDATATHIASADMSTTLAPHGFARSTYVVKLNTVGRVVIELADASATGTVINVAPSGAVATAKPEQQTQSPPTNPLEAVVQRDPNYRTEDGGLVEYLAYRIHPYEPTYILGGGQNPELKFQLSFKYQAFDPNGSLAQALPPLSGVYFGYSQTSFWDIDGVSNPFFDTSYRPEALLSYDHLDNYLVDHNADRLLPDWLHLGFQGGLKHESNGKDGDESRSVNIVYARPIFTFSGQDGWFVSVAPSVFAYVGDLSDNPDIADYRGHADLRLVIGQGGGVQLAAIGRLGDDGDRGSLQLDLSFPIRQLTFGNFDVYFDAQYFTGYGESLLDYNQRDDSLRFGISLVR